MLGSGTTETDRFLSGAVCFRLRGIPISVANAIIKKRRESWGTWTRKSRKRIN